MSYVFLYRHQQHVTEQTKRVGSYGMLVCLHAGKAFWEVSCWVRWFSICDDHEGGSSIFDDAQWQPGKALISNHTVNVKSIMMSPKWSSFISYIFFMVKLRKNPQNDSLTKDALVLCFIVMFTQGAVNHTECDLLSNSVPGFSSWTFWEHYEYLYMEISIFRQINVYMLHMWLTNPIIKYK